MDESDSLSPSTTDHQRVTTPQTSVPNESYSTPTNPKGKIVPRHEMAGGI
jgi:hypothetical protein